MALSFRKKKKGTKPIYIILSVLALLITATLLTIWLVIGYHRSVPTPEENGNTTSAPTYEEPIPDVASCLVILKMENHTTFLLVQTNPEEKRISVVPIPAIIANADGRTLSQLFKSNGPGHVIQTLEKALQLPVNHYISLDADGINKFLSDLDQGITLKLPQSVSYTDENGLSSTIRAGKRQLTASQAVAVLEHTNWESGDYEERVAADMFAALMNHYLTADRSIRGYFGALANVSQTDLRIDNYIAYSSALTILAESNSGSVCTVIPLDGEIKGGYFLPNAEAMRLNSGLHFDAKEDDR